MTSIPEPPIVSARIGLRLLGADLNRAVLDSLRARPMRLGDLCAHLMLESDTTLREHLDELEAHGIARRQGESRGFGGRYQLTPAGEALLGVMGWAGGWLTNHPERSLSPRSDVAWHAFAALADAWELSLIQHLLLQPSTKRELLATIPMLNRAKARRLLRRLRGAGLLRSLDDDDPAPRYALSGWARRAVYVLASIARWERAHLGITAEPVAAGDGAIALLAALPLIRPPADVDGVCTFTVEVGPGGSTPRSSAVWARLADGRVASCKSGSCPSVPDAWVRGRVDAWFEAVFDARPAALQLGGVRALAESAVRCLHEDFIELSTAPC
jgi:DNA-binding HxlR family transcriptional regulator